MRRKLFLILTLVFVGGILAALLLHPVLFPESFPEASGTLSIVSRSNPKTVGGMDRYIDFTRLDDDTWAADAAGEEVFLPYGMIYEIKSGEIQAVKGHGTISDLGFAFNSKLQTYYGVLGDPEGQYGTVCTFALEEGKNEFSLEFKQKDVLYSNETAAVSNPLYLDSILYFIEENRVQDGTNLNCQTLYRYEIETKIKKELATGELIFGYGAAGANLCYSTLTEERSNTYVVGSNGEAEILEENADVCGRSSDGQRVLIKYYGEEGRVTSISVYDCEKGGFLSKFDLKESWGQLMTGTISPDSRFVAACFQTGTEKYQMRVIDTETKRQIPLFQALDNLSGYCMDWS